MARAVVAGAEGVRTVVRHDDGATRTDDDWCGSRNDDRGCHDRCRRHNDRRGLCHDNGLRHDRSGLRYNDRSRLRHNRSRLCYDDWSRLRHNRSRLCDDDRCWLCDNGRLRIDDDGGWRLDGFRDIGDGVHDIKHRVEAAVVEGSAVMVMGLSLKVVACQQQGGDGQTEDGVACVLHGVLLFRRLVCLLTCLCFPSSPNQYHVFLFFSSFFSFSLILVCVVPCGFIKPIWERFSFF